MTRLKLRDVPGPALWLIVAGLALGSSRTLRSCYDDAQESPRPVAHKSSDCFAFGEAPIGIEASLCCTDLSGYGQICMTRDAAAADRLWVWWVPAHYVDCTATEGLAITWVGCGS